MFQGVADGRYRPSLLIEMVRANVLELFINQSFFVFSENVTHLTRLLTGMTNT